MDNTLIDRAVIQSEFRTERDLFDRIAGGAGPGGVKAVAPSGTEFITMRAARGRRRAGEHARGEADGACGPTATDTFVLRGRPMATISNVMVEYRPGPPPKKAPARKP